MAKVFNHLLSMPQVQMQDRQALQSACDALSQGFDFADALHHASSRHCDALVTFDAKGFGNIALGDKAGVLGDPLADLIFGRNGVHGLCLTRHDTQDHRPPFHLGENTPAGGIRSWPQEPPAGVFGPR